MAHQEFRSLRSTAQSIGFHELRQALEISSLKQDLERVARETGDLRTHIEEAVESVRAQFAALTPEELADAVRMAPLLQSAVKTLLGIRDAARRIEVTAGPVADADRPDPPPPSLLHTARPEGEAPPPTEPSVPLPQPPALAPVQAAAPSMPAPADPGSPLSPASFSPAPFNPAPFSQPPRMPPSAGAPARSPASAQRPTRPAGGSSSGVDWLGPPRR